MGNCILALHGNHRAHVIFTAQRCIGATHAIGPTIMLKSLLILPAQRLDLEASAIRLPQNFDEESRHALQVIAQCEGRIEDNKAVTIEPIDIPRRSHVEFDRQKLVEFEGCQLLLEFGDRPRILDRVPQEKRAGGKTPNALAKSVDKPAQLTGLFKRRIDKNNPAPFLRRQSGLQRDVPVDSHCLGVFVGRQNTLQRVPVLRMQLVGDQRVVRTQEFRSDEWTPG